MKLFRHKFRIAVCLALALPVLYVVEEHLRGRWLLARWKSAMSEKGEKFQIDECLPSQQPGDNGFASLASAAAIQPSPELSRLIPPTLRFTGPGRLISILTISNWPPSFSSPAGSEKSNVTWAQLGEELAQWTNVLDDARAALEASMFDGRLDYHAGFNLPLPHLARFKSLAQRFNAAGASALHAGRSEEALVHLEAILTLNRAMEHERLLISQLVRQAISNIAFGTTWQLLQERGWTDAQLARLQHAWQLQEFVAACGHALEMERAMSSDTYRAMRRSAKEAANVVGVGGGGLGGTPPPKPVQSLSDMADYLVNDSGELTFKVLYLPLWQMAWSHQDELNYLECTQPLIAAARSCAEQKSGAPALAADKQLSQRAGGEVIAGRWRFLLSSQIAGPLEGAVPKSISAEVLRELTVAAIALKRYELKHGRHATDLQTLVPDFLSELPRDYWSDAPLVYRLRDNGSFLLYSVGRNGRDDGGDATPVERKSKNFSLIGGQDFVWPDASPAEEAAAALAPSPPKRPPSPGPQPQ